MIKSISFTFLFFLFFSLALSSDQLSSKNKDFVIEFIHDDSIQFFLDRLNRDSVISPRYKVIDFPDALLRMRLLSVTRGSPVHPSKDYRVLLKKTRTIFLGVHERGEHSVPLGWSPTDLYISIDGRQSSRFIIYRKIILANTEINVPKNYGRSGRIYALPSILIF